MRRIVSLAGCLVLAGCVQPAVLAPLGAPPDEPVPAGGGKAPADAPAEAFHFPDDKGGQLLGTLLTPADHDRHAMTSSPKRPFPPLRSLEQPEVLPPLQAAPVTLPPPPKAAPLKPGHPPEEPPLTSARGRALPPEKEPLATGLLVRTPSAPVEQPVAPPVLARPAPDRASLDDPTRDASLEAALSADPPARPGPAPFVPTKSPDPFENRETVKVKSAPAEDAHPVVGPPRPPKP